MKNLALLLVFALLTLALPVSAAETSEAPPTPTLEQQTEGPVAPLEMIKVFPVPTPYCHQVQGTSCTTLGATKACTDACSNQLSCTCTYYSPTVRFWNCAIEC